LNSIVFDEVILLQKQIQAIQYSIFYNAYYHKVMLLLLL